MQPILGGSSHLLQDSLTVSVGLGNAIKGNVEIIWPGGVRNKLKNVMTGERLIIPEIHVSFADKSLSKSEYMNKLQTSLNELMATGIITKKFSKRLHKSAVTSFVKHNKK